MKKFDVIVIGGGASGLVAAIASSRSGEKTAILERLPRVGKKILVTGNGRCNFSNTHIGKKKYHGTHPSFISHTFAQFDGSQILSFFQELGILHKIEDGKIYPRCDQAGAILDVLRYECDRIHVETICDQDISAITENGDIFAVKTTNGDTLYSKKIIISTGGKASPQFGSNGSGFELAKGLGHSIVKPSPSLVQIKLDDEFLNHLKGVKVDARVSLYANESLVDEQRGEILFTDYGLSGIPVLQLSRYVHHPELQNKNLMLHVDFFSEMQFHDLKTMLIERFHKLEYKSIHDALIGLVNKRIILPLLKKIHVDHQVLCKDLSSSQVESITHQLKDRRFEIKGTLSWRDAQVTAGGVSTDEIDEKTLGSKIVSGLFFTGEVIDIHGDSGGYNLAWAWASGYVAGMNAGRK